MALTLEDLQKIVSDRAFDRLIGEVENAFFDCKKQPYRIEEEHGKRELAKDVSAFANSQGGYIFIGMTTKASETHLGDEVTEIHPLDPKLVHRKQYEDIAASWIYPSIDGLTVEFYETANGKGIVVITIPLPDDGARPFLIRKLIDGKKIVETVFGYAERRGDGTKIHSVEDIQRTLRAGLTFDREIANRLSNIEVLLVDRTVTGGTEAAEAEKSKELLKERISRALKHQGMDKRRLLFLAARPSDTVELRSIFSASSGSLRRSLENPPVLRNGGWDLATFDQARIVEGEFIQVANGARMVVDLYRDGLLLFAGVADGDLLAWGDKARRKFNSLAVVEIIYSFARFYELVLADFSTPPPSMTFHVGLRNMHLDGEASYLLPHSNKSTAQMFGDEARNAPADTWEYEIDVPRVGYHAAVVAMLLVREFYHWFGFDDEKIPYTKVEDGNAMIDAETIASLR